MRWTLSRDKWGTTPRDVVVNNAGVSVWTEGVPSSRSMLMLPVRGPYLPEGEDPVRVKRGREAMKARAREDSMYRVEVREIDAQ